MYMTYFLLYTRALQIKGNQYFEVSSDFTSCIAAITFSWISFPAATTP